MNIPAFLRPAPKQISALKVVAKSTLKALIMAFGGWVTLKLGGDPEVAALVAVALAPLLKVIDPSDKSIGVKS